MMPRASRQSSADRPASDPSAMRRRRGVGAMAGLAVLACAVLLGCASSSDVDDLRAELDATEARTASNEARLAAESAQASATEAKEATEKAERIFQKALRK